MRGKQFSLSKRGKVWYVRYKTANNTFSTAKSTGQTKRSEAESFVIDTLRGGHVVLRDNITLEEFSRNFFDWDGAWATDKRVRRLHISERHCRELSRTLRNHIIPAMGEKRLTEIDTGFIRDFRNNLFNAGLSGATINHIQQIIKTLLVAAEEHSLIRSIPKIERVGNTPKTKGILKIEEVRSLFKVEWADFRAYTASMIASATGLRLGEVLGLVVSDFFPQEQRLHCRRSWDQALRKLNKTTKTGRARNVFIPTQVNEAIKRLIEMNPFPLTDDTFIFYADKSNAYPTEAKTITEGFYNAMAKIGITEEVRRARNITFHSHRHFLNSLLLNANIPLQKIQSITGHLTLEMTQHYYHLDEMEDVQRVQEGLFQTGKN